MENLRRAHQNARKGKSHYEEVRMVDANPDYYLKLIQDSLIYKTFSTAAYTQKMVYEPKQRIIYKLPYFPDRIVHHAVMQVMQPIWDKQFIYDLYSAIPGKGLHAGSYRLRHFLKDKENTKYCLKFDVSKFYPSIQPDILFEFVKQTLKDPDLLWILEDVIFSSPDGGVPIGNYLSQYFSNLYLTPFDHWIKEKLGMKYYIRYCDDGVILHADREKLKEVKEKIADYFDTLGLKLNPKTSIFSVDRCGVDFLGYRCFRTHTILRKSSTRKFRKAIRNIEHNYLSMSPSEIIGPIGAYNGWLEHCDSHNLKRKYLETPEIYNAIKHANKIGGTSCQKLLEAI
jgi:retron-type reverse transcriptase